MLKKIMARIKQILGNEVGGEYTESAFWMALVVLVGIGAVTTLGLVVRNKIQAVANNINS